MPSKRQKNAGWLLPADIETIKAAPVINVCVPIPDLQEMKIALRGAVYELARWYNWERTGDTFGAETGEYMKELLECMSFDCCQIIADCIANSDAVRDALKDLFDNDFGDRGSDGELPPVMEENPTLAIDCDYNNLFGACTGLVDIIHQTIVDLFEIIEALTNNIELANEVLEAIPILNLFTNFLDIANVLQEQLAENYDAAYTLAVRDDLRCGLFCAAKDDCTIDFFRFAEYFGHLAGQSVFTLDLDDALEYFLQGTFSGVEVVYIAYWFVASMMAYGGSVLGLDADRLVKLAQAALNDPDPDWNILCECAWSHTFDFTVSDHGFSTFVVGSGAIGGEYVPGMGWHTTNVLYNGGAGNEARTFVSIQLELESVVNFTRIEVTGDVTFGTWADATRPAFTCLIYGTDVSISKDRDDMVNGAFNFNDDGDGNSQAIQCWLRASRDIYSPFVYDGDGYITSITVYGTGPNPFN